MRLIYGDRCDACKTGMFNFYWNANTKNKQRIRVLEMENRTQSSFLIAPNDLQAVKEKMGFDFSNSIK